MTLFAYPQKAAYGRIVPKTKIYERASPSAALKKLFVDQVEQIVWSHKLAPETTNVKATKAVPEIQVFSITLKTGVLKEDVLRCIDRAIPFPILFELSYNGQIKTTACYKRPSEADSAKWVISPYFEREWQTADTERQALSIALDMGALYAELLGAIIPYPARQGETLQERVTRAESIRSREGERDKAQARLDKEKQFNRKVEINAIIRTLDKEIEGLKSWKN